MLGVSCIEMSFSIKQRTCLKNVLPTKISVQSWSLVENMYAQKSHTNMIRAPRKLHDIRAMISKDSLDIDSRCLLFYGWVFFFYHSSLSYMLTPI